MNTREKEKEVIYRSDTTSDASSATAVIVSFLAVCLLGALVYFIASSMNSTPTIIPGPSSTTNTTIKETVPGPSTTNTIPIPVPTPTPAPAPAPAPQAPAPSTPDSSVPSPSGSSQ